MNKRIYALCILFISFFMMACSNIPVSKTNTEKSSNKTVVKEQPQNSDNLNKTSESSAFFNKELQQYEIIDGYSEGFLEIMGEKISFDGKDYKEISNAINERIMFNAVRFFKAAASGDYDTTKNMSDKNLCEEITKAIDKQKGASFVSGGDFVVAIKDLSEYEKPISITAPLSISENEFIVYMEYMNNNTKKNTKIVLNIDKNEVKVISFLEKKH